MKVERRDGAIERTVLLGMVVDPIVLGRISIRWESNMFRSRWSNLVGQWCVQFFKKYDKAPRNSIQGMFESWQNRTSDKDTAALVEKFLASLSEEYETLAEESNSEYVIDLAARHFNKVRLERLRDELEGDLDSGKEEEAFARVSTFSKLEMGVGAGIDVLRDKDAIRSVFAEKQEPLIVYPGDLGKFFGGALERDAFIALMGPEKRGKSLLLLDIAWRAMSQRRKVAFIEAGDMSQNQIMRRFLVRAAGRPFAPGSIEYPTEVTFAAGDRTADVRVEKREFTKGLSWQKAWRACQKVLQEKAKSNETLLKLSCYPNSTISVQGIQTLLDLWEREGWIPDVIVIDYADILAPLPGYRELRDQIDANWKALRALSQSRHCLVVTATQSDAASYKARVLGRSHFSDDKRKLAHVTGMVGLNETEEEKGLGVLRLNWIVLREGAFSQAKCVYLAGCRAIANVAVRSTF